MRKENTICSHRRAALGHAALGWTIALLLGASGCIPLPALSPPVKASVGFGAAIGNPAPNDEGIPISDAEAMLIGRVGVVPQAAWPQQHRRPVEVSAGYTFQIFLNGNFEARNRHGGYLGVDLLLADHELGSRWRGRMTLRVMGEVLALQGVSGVGGGGTVAVGYEAAYFTWADGGTGSETGPRFLGVATGELGLGGELFGGYYDFDGADYGVVGLALTVRWPAAAGLAIIPVAGSF